MGKQLNAEKIELKVSLKGIIKLFGSKIYSEFGAIVKELIQNGHDTCLEDFSNKRKDNSALSNYWVNVHYDSRSKTLIIADNGVGMDVNDVSIKFNDFATPKKENVREFVKESTEGDPLYIIGIYGVGFLSALAISSNVDVWSRKNSGKPILWQYQEGSSFASVKEIKNEEFEQIQKRYGANSTVNSGTIVFCNPSEENVPNLTSNELLENLKQYCRLLKVPIFFNDELITDNSVAWNNPSRATEEDWAEMIKDFTGSSPLLTIPIYSPMSELDIEGVLWIPERGKLLGDDGYINIYIRRMFVSKDDSYIRPHWASFIMGMINSNKLDRVLAGNEIIKDKHVVKVQNFVKNQILNSFQKIRDLPESDYWKIIGGYDHILKLVAADYTELMDCVWDKLRVRTTKSWVTIKEYLAEIKLHTGDDDIIYYFDNSNHEFTARLISEATRLPILSMYSLNDEKFVTSICRFRNIALHSYAELASKALKNPEKESIFNALIAVCKGLNLGVEIEVKDFQPNYLPALLIEDQSLNYRKEAWVHFLKSSEDPLNQRLGGSLQLGQSRSNISFYLNCSNPLIRKLINCTIDTQKSTIKALYNISYMSAMPQLDRPEIQSVFESVTNLLMTTMREKDSENESLNSKICRPTRLLMITPFSDKYNNLEIAVRDLFEGPPYFFQIVVARDFMHKSQLLEDVRAHIEAADGYIAEITELNANVMLELGAVLIKNDKKKPVFLFRGSASKGKKDVPADLKAELYIAYGALTDKIDDIVSSIRSKIESNGKPTHQSIINLIEDQTCLCLTKRLLQKTRCNDEEQNKILKHFETVESLLDATPKEIARKTGVTTSIAQFLHEELKNAIKK